jgi:hypothetical protein
MLIFWIESAGNRTSHQINFGPERVESLVDHLKKMIYDRGAVRGRVTFVVTIL